MKQGTIHLEGELAKLKEEMRHLEALKAAMADQRLRHEQKISDLKQRLELQRGVSDRERESQEQGAQAVAVVRNVVVQLTGELEDLRSENGHDRSGVGEMARANKQLQMEAARLRQRIEVLEQDTHRLSRVNELVKREVRDVSDCYPKVKKGLTNLEQELAKLKEEMRAAKSQTDPIAAPAADVLVPPAPKAASQAP